MDSGRKLPSELECPLDDIILKYIVTPINPIFYSLGATPNILTGVSGIFGLLSIYYAYTSDYILSALFIAISYIFDCFDGNFARKYDMVTEFGDWFDHIKDITVLILLLLVLSFKKGVKSSTKILLFIGFIVLLLMTNCYILHQEDYYHTFFPGNEKSDTLRVFSDLIRSMFPEKDLRLFEERFKYTKYCGCSTVYVYVVFVLLFFNSKK